MLATSSSTSSTGGSARPPAPPPATFLLSRYSVCAPATKRSGVNSGSPGCGTTQRAMSLSRSDVVVPQRRTAGPGGDIDRAVGLRVQPLGAGQRVRGRGVAGRPQDPYRSVVGLVVEPAVGIQQGAVGQVGGQQQVGQQLGGRRPPDLPVLV